MATTVVNMIPNALSGEANQDSEPMVAVNLANPQQIAGSAFTPDPANGPNAPIYVSTDGGNTWALNTIVPSNPATGDLCMRFGTQGNRLYIGILRQPDGLRMNILRTTNFTAAGAATLLVDRGPTPALDQPFVQAATLMAGAGVGTDRVYVGNNDFANAPNTATVDVSLDGGGAVPPPPANFNGALDIVVTASDALHSVSDTFRLTVSPVNDAPSLATPHAFAAPLVDVVCPNAPRPFGQRP